MDNKFFQTVAKMREAQKLYFKTRNYAVLKECKLLEKEVDELIARIKEKNEPKMQSLF